MASIMSVSSSNDNRNSVTRVTKEGKKLTYEMNVIQQPERARACGSGAKCESLTYFYSTTSQATGPDRFLASADRRPVDPPPVVELRIFEGDAKNDITFSYNANFFLYTTLESARPIAQGRVSSVPTPFPVLTGMPVAGMAYLDRPSPAGYFIFPDLSVRHEGKYKLAFNLFEELKESKDADAEPALTSPDHPNNQAVKNNAMAPQSHMHFRLEVKSDPFVVYSAKKFPGLAESTSLSRVVAEQGCRVRIRRDVRMRRRDAKPNKDYDDYDEDNIYSRTDRFATPDVYSHPQITERPRSASHGSVEMSIPYGMEQRRSSMHDQNYYAQPTYQQVQQPAPPPSIGSNGYTTHLTFGSTATPHYQTPAFPPQAMAQPPQPYAQNNTAYQYQPTSHVRQMSASSPQGYGYPPNQTYQQSQYFPTQPFSEGNDYRPITDYRRVSAPQPQVHQVHQTQIANPYPTDTRPAPIQQSYYPPPTPVSIARSVTPVMNGQALPPLKTLQPSLDRKYEPASPATSLPPSAIGTYQAPHVEVAQNKYASYPTPQPMTSDPVRSSKRQYATVFDTKHLNQPMYSGARPNAALMAQEVPQVEAEDGKYDELTDLPDLKVLSYRRADGSKTMKKCPSPVSV